MVAIGQTITVVNKSGKVVKTSKHLTNVFKEAKSAYLERKAELKSGQGDDLSHKSSKDKVSAQDRGDHKGRDHTPSSRRSSRRSSRDYDDRHSNAETVYARGKQRSSRDYDDRHSNAETVYARGKQRSSRDYDDRRSDAGTVYAPGKRPSADRGYSDSFYTNDPPSSSHHKRRTSTTPLTASNLRHATTPTSSSPSSPRPSRRKSGLSSLSATSFERTELTRRHSDAEFTLSSGRTIRPADLDVDPDLAYGELPPPLPLPARHLNEEQQLRQKMTALQRLLQEANCVQHSAKAVVKQLENDPDAMASVALSLAECSNLAMKMAPGALMALKGTFPLVMALLLSPEFLVAGGVALGVTVVSFGGYKIVKKLKVKKKEKKLLKEQADSKAASQLDDDEDDDEEEDDADDLEELTNLDRIDQWRRGIQLPPEMDTASVDGEFVTPKAAKALRDEGAMSPASKKEKVKEKSKEKDSKGKAKDLKTREKELEKREKELAKREKEIHAKVKADAKADAKAEKMASKQKQITYEELPRKDSVVGDGQESESTLRKEEKEREEGKFADMQSMVKSLFKGTKEKLAKDKAKGEVIA